ncbi:hypothetical protein NDU88_007366 [Pleurodeles waltl]|uniref:Uncharacterized protein n=1 Tax=Pleurodeles waltl TaxID=8319 RepID=A0AAV7N1W5_PLEWA|nr:hypothetical protein NDU88_007366 [Pleurodeles waltl]
MLPITPRDAGIETLRGAVGAIAAGHLYGCLKRSRLRGQYRGWGLRGLAEALLRCALGRGSVQDRTWWDPSGPLPESGGGPLSLARAGWDGVPGHRGDDPWSRGLPLDLELGAWPDDALPAAGVPCRGRPVRWSPT